MIIILSFRIGISKNKNIDHRVKETCAICQHKLHMKPTTSLCPVIQQCQVHQNFAFYVFYCSLKEKDHIKRNINSKKKIFICEISITIILICDKIGSVGSAQ